MHVTSLTYTLTTATTRINGEWFIAVTAGFAGQPLDRWRVGPIPLENLEAVRRDIKKAYEGIIEQCQIALDKQLHDMMHPNAEPIAPDLDEGMDEHDLHTDDLL